VELGLVSQISPSDSNVLQVRHLLYPPFGGISDRLFQRILEPLREIIELGLQNPTGPLVRLLPYQHFLWSMEAGTGNS
jgi:hypothetical protein